MRLTRELIIKELNYNLKYGEYETSLIVDYLINLSELNLLPDSVTYKDLIAKLEKYNVNIVFFDDNHEVAKKYGNQFKGKTDIDKNGNAIIYVRDSLVDKELYFYHELTHLFQTREKVKVVGREYDLNTWQFEETINEFNPTGLEDDRGLGNIFNEVATQFLAEKIYKRKYGIESEYVLYNSEDLRMNSGYEIWSDLKNYQMYDYIISLMLEGLDINKDDLIKMAFDSNYIFKDFLKEKWEKDNDVEFEQVWNILELIYKIDVQVYTGNEEVRNNLYKGESYWFTNSYNTFLARGSLNDQLQYYKDYCNYFKLLISEKEEKINNKLR